MTCNELRLNFSMFDMTLSLVIEVSNRKVIMFCVPKSIAGILNLQLPGVHFEA